MARLKKVANNIEELGEMNMTQDILNQILYNAGEDITVANIVYRRLMNSNTKFVVEMWVMSDNTFCVFAGTFDGMWTLNNIEYHGNFASESESETYVQLNLQTKAEYNEVVMVQSRLRKNDFMRKHAAGKEPDYREIAEGFAKTVNVDVPDIEKGQANTLNKYYDDFTNYMQKYYPEWAKYPAFIWTGWGYFVDNFGKDEESKEDSKNEDSKDENIVEEKQDVKETNEADEVQEVQEVQELQDTQEVQETQPANDTIINDQTVDFGGGGDSSS